MSDKQRCSALVYDTRNDIQCSFSAQSAYEHNGNPYCGIHYPPRVAKRKGLPITTTKRYRLAADYDRLAAENERLTSELSELKALINDDGSLTEHDEHIDILGEAMHYHRQWNRLVTENERLNARLKEACQLAHCLSECAEYGPDGCVMHGLQAQWAAEDAAR